MNPVPGEVRVPGATDADARGEPELERGVPIWFQPESGAVPHEAPPDDDNGSEPGDDL